MARQLPNKAMRTLRGQISVPGKLMKTEFGFPNVLRPVSLSFEVERQSIGRASLRLFARGDNVAGER